MPTRARGFGVIEKIKRSAIFDEAWLVETAAFPFAANLRKETGRVNLPVQKVFAPTKADDGRAFFVAGIRIGVIDAEETAAHFFEFALGVDVVFADDPIHGDVET